MKLTKPKDRPIYKLPDSTTTLSPQKYGEAWRALAAPIERALECKVMAFDPGFLFDLGGGRSLDLPADVVRKLGERLEDLELQLSTAEYALMGEDL